MNLNPTIWQDNAITRARYEMTALEKNIMYMVLAQIHKDDTPDTLYRVHVLELSQIMQTEIKYGHMLRATGKLVSRLFQTTLANGDTLQATFFSSVRYLKGQGIIEVELSRHVRPFFFELKEKFTTYQLNTALSLNSKYAKRLYELFSSYKALPEPRFRINVIDLKQQLGVIDEKGIDKYLRWTHFRTAVLEPAYKEINGAGELTFEFTPIKIGRAVVQLEFVVSHMGSKPESVQIEQPPVFTRLQEKYGLRPDQATKVMTSFSLEHINKTLHAIQLQMASKSINNIGAYTAATFNV